MVRLVKITEETDSDEYEYGYGTQDNTYIDVQNNEGSLDILPVEPTRLLSDFLDDKNVEIVASVSSVTPLSQKTRSNAKKASIFVHIETKILEENENMIRFSDIAELCRFLTEAVEDDCWENGSYGDEDYMEEDEEDYIDEDSDDENESNHEEIMKNRKKKFTEDVIREVKSIDNISKIIVERDYQAWGEFADLVADNDFDLVELAQKVQSSSGAERDKAKKEMLEYIHTPMPFRKGESFGQGVGEVRYAFSDDDDDLENLVKRLCSNYGPAGGVSGSEHYEIDLETGEYSDFGVFGLE